MNGYYTVKEFAKKYNKDTGNIRRMLIKGTIKGEKVGNQWLIPSNVSFPDDSRVKSGSYVNQRKKALLYKKQPLLMHSLLLMSKELQKLYGSDIEKIVLYGSYSRGEETEESDVDLAIFLKEEETESMHDKRVEIVVDYELDLAVTLSVITIDLKNYNEWRKTLPFYKNIDKDGIILWKAA